MSFSLTSFFWYMEYENRFPWSFDPYCLVFFEDHPFQTVQTTHPKLTLTLGGCASFQASKSEGCTTALCAGGFDRDTWWNWVIGRNGRSEEVILQISGHRFWRKESKKKAARNCFVVDIKVWYICMWKGPLCIEWRCLKYRSITAG